ALTQQAATLQANAGYESSTATAGGEFQAANLATRARQLMGVGGIRGQQQTQLSSIYAARTNQILSAQAGKELGINSAGATAALVKSDIGVRTGQQVTDLQISRQQGLQSIEINRAADTQDFVGRKVNAASAYIGDGVKSLSKEYGESEGGATGGAVKWGGRAAGTVIEVGGAAYGWHEQYEAIQNRASGQSSVINQSTDARIVNQQQTQQGLAGNQDTYLQSMTANYEQNAARLITAANLSANQAAAGVNRGAGIQINAINEGTKLELSGNQARYDAQVHAAEITRGAAIEAARLQAFSTVLHQVGNKIARDMERGRERLF